jgi:thiol-disulfide isomerase/thioredoxin
LPIPVKTAKTARLSPALWRFLTALTAVVSLLAAASCQRAPKGVINVGDTAPDYLLTDLRDEKFSMSEYKGSVVLLEFWTTWCPTCRDSVPYLNSLNRDYSGRGLVLMSINLDEGVDRDQAVRQDVRLFAAKHNVGYRVLFNDVLTERIYDVNVLPTLFLIDRKQRIVKRYAGINPRLLNDIKSEMERLF